MAQCSQDSNRCVHAREQISNSHTYFLRTATNIVALSSHTHQAANTLHSIVITRTFAVRPRLSKARHTAIHQTRIDLGKRCEVQTITRHITDFEIFDKHIADQSQGANNLLALLRGNIAGDRSLVAVGAHVIGGIGRVVASSVFQKWRPPTARVVAKFGALNFDNVCA